MTPAAEHKRRKVAAMYAQTNNLSEVARQLGLSRERVSQILGRPVKARRVGQ